MTAMTNIKSMITKRTAGNKTKTGSNSPKKDNLKKAIVAAEKKQATSEMIKDLAITQELENQMARDMAKEIDMEFNLGFEKSSSNPLSVDIDGKTILGEGENKEGKSKLVLELNRKQSAMQDIYLQMQQGASLLDTLVKQSEHISDFLFKSEIELTRLQTVEAKYAKLCSASEVLAKEHRELKSKLEEKYKQVNLLEGQKHKTRDMLDKAQLEINRLTEQGNAQSAEIHSQEIILSKLRDENQSIEERNSILAHELAETRKQNKDLQVKLDDAQNDLSTMEKSLSKANMKVDTVTRENEQTAVDILDIQARYTSLNDRHAETMSTLEEVRYELDSERSSFDEKLRLKDARIMKMERKIEVLTRQVSLTEQMIGELGDDNAEDLNDKLQKMKTAPCKKQTVASNVTNIKQAEVSAAR